MHLITLFRVTNPHQRCLHAKVKYGNDPKTGESKSYIHRRCFLCFDVSFLFPKLINILVVRVDLHRIHPEFHAFHSF